MVGDGRFTRPASTPRRVECCRRRDPHRAGDRQIAVVVPRSALGAVDLATAMYAVAMLGNAERGEDIGFVGRSTTTTTGTSLRPTSPGSRSSASAAGVARGSTSTPRSRRVQIRYRAESAHRLDRDAIERWKGDHQILKPAATSAATRRRGRPRKNADTGPGGDKMPSALRVSGASPAKKAAISRIVSDGETRTRTGDTTIFSRGLKAFQPCRKSCNFADSRRVPGARRSPQFACFSRGFRHRNARRRLNAVNRNPCHRAVGEVGADVTTGL